MSVFTVQLLIAAELQVATVRNQVVLSLFDDFENMTEFKPQARHEESVADLLDQLIAWGGAMRDVRAAKKSKALEQG